MLELFSFSTYSDGHVEVWHSPLNGVLRLHAAVPPSTSLDQAHFIEHCLVEAHRNDVIQDGGTILGATTAERVTVTLLLPPGTDLQRYHCLADVDITPELVEKVAPLLDAEARARGLGAVGLRSPEYTMRDVSDELAAVLCSWKEARVIRIICFHSAAPGHDFAHNYTRLDEGILNSCHHTPPHKHLDSLAHELTSYVRQRLALVIPEGVAPEWDDSVFRSLARRRFRCLLKSPSFFVRELEELLGRGYTASAFNCAFAAFCQ